MPRRQPSRRGVTTIAGPRYQCVGRDSAVSWQRLACPSCWRILADAPGGLRDRLTLPAGENPHQKTGHAWRADVAAAEAFLARVRRGTAGDAG